MPTGITLTSDERALLERLLEEQESYHAHWTERLAYVLTMEGTSPLRSGCHLAHWESYVATRTGLTAGYAFHHAECIMGLKEVLASAVES